MINMQVSCMFGTCLNSACFTMWMLCDVSQKKYLTKLRIIFNSLPCLFHTSTWKPLSSKRVSREFWDSFLAMTCQADDITHIWQRSGRGQLVWNIFTPDTLSIRFPSVTFVRSSSLFSRLRIPANCGQTWSGIPTQCVTTLYYSLLIVSLDNTLYE